MTFKRKEFPKCSQRNPEISANLIAPFSDHMNTRVFMFQPKPHMYTDVRIHLMYKRKQNDWQGWGRGARCVERAGNPLSGLNYHNDSKNRSIAWSENIISRRDEAFGAYSPARSVLCSHTARMDSAFSRSLIHICIYTCMYGSSPLMPEAPNKRRKIVAHRE